MKVPSVIADTLKGLVSRRLWPVAVLLLAALAAVPFVLARSAEPVAPATASTATTGKDGATESLVSLGGTTADGRRRVLGTAKDPFQPAPTPKKKKASAKQAKTAAKDADSTSTITGGTSAPTGTTGSGDTTTPSGGAGSGTSGSGSTGSGSGSGSTRNSLVVRFGSADSGSLESTTVSALEALPSKDEPVAIFLGLENHGKTAVFMLGDGVTVDGDGACAPSASQCDTVRLKAGETEFLTVSGSNALADGEYQLDIVKIRR